ncbi:MAG: pyrimidine/purine nucleoside phosphorylase [Endomicrobiales bacterium]
MPGIVPEQFDNVGVKVKANVYYDGKVVSHTLLFKEGGRKTLGLIYPGEYTFTTEAPECMDIIAGSCRVRLNGQSRWMIYPRGSYFKVPARSSFEISVEQGVVEYLCTYE